MKIMFLGDSVTDFYRDKNDDKILGAGYATLVAAELSYKYPQKYEFLNRGVSGNKSIDILARLKGDVIKFAPDYVSLLVGVNDVWHDIDYGCGVTPQKYEIYCDMIVKEIKESLPNTETVIMEPFILDGQIEKGIKLGDEIVITDDRTDRFHNGILAVSKAAQNVANKNSLKFIPLQKHFNEALKYAPVEYWLYDGVHPTFAGHQIINNAWMQNFEEFIKGREA